MAEQPQQTPAQSVPKTEYTAPNIPAKAMVLFHGAWWKEMVSKDGQFSKTAFMLSFSFMIMVFLWVFQELFHGTKFVFEGWGPLDSWEWVVPPFDSVAAMAVFMPICALYFGKSNVFMGKGPSA